MTKKHAPVIVSRRWDPVIKATTVPKTHKADGGRTGAEY